jgi:hypothetical protein
MQSFIYWDNSKGWHSEFLLLVENQPDILTADEIFKQTFGMKKIPNTVSVQISENKV